MISIHVPIHDEPPELVKRTLTILSKINYQNYEVIVIDTNTEDRETLRSIR
jgi:cellulose synthase/poly-beta-1,6-N-acetylglucosamine synthase-like glycosyltransferase